LANQLPYAVINERSSVVTEIPPHFISVAMHHTPLLLSSLNVFLSSFFFIAGRGPAYFWTSALRPCNNSARLPRARRGIGRCVQMCA